MDPQLDDKLKKQNSYSCFGGLKILVLINAVVAEKLFTVKIVQLACGLTENDT